MKAEAYFPFEDFDKINVTIKLEMTFAELKSLKSQLSINGETRERAALDLYHILHEVMSDFATKTHAAAEKGTTIPRVY